MIQLVPIPSWYWLNFCWFPAFHKIPLSVGIEYLLKWWCHSDSTSGFVTFLIPCFISSFAETLKRYLKYYGLLFISEMIWFLFCFCSFVCFLGGICSVLTHLLSSSGMWVIFWTLGKLVGYYRMEAFRYKDCYLTPQLADTFSHVCCNIYYKI